MAEYVETARDGLIVLKPPPLALHGARVEDGEPLKDRILAALDRGDVLIDLSAVEAGGDLSVGLRALMVGVRAALASGKALLLAAPQPVVREKLEINRYPVQCAIFDTLDEAIEGYATRSLAKAIGGGPVARTRPARFAVEGD
jgi:anti-anti-sigma regulatory factor